MPPPPRPAMLLSVPLLLGLLGLVAADPAVYFKEQFLDGGKVSARLEAALAAAGPRDLGCLVVCNVITVQRANTVAPGGTRAAGGSICASFGDEEGAAVSRARS